MRLTTARYYTPSGRSIQAKGIVPDIVVEQAKIETINNGRQRREADLRRALDTKQREEEKKGKDGERKKQGVEKKPAPGKTGGAAAKKAKPAQDYQLSRAVDLLRGIALFKSRAVN